MSKRVLEVLEKALGDGVIATHSQFGDDTAVIDPKRWKEAAVCLRDDKKLRMVVPP